jgi:5'(3')-deoxyribonucleotidase
MSKTILVDCDGVLSNLIHSVVQLAHEKAGIYVREEDVTDYDYGRGIGWPSWGFAVEEATKKREFVYRMRPYSGATVFLRELERKAGKDNVFVCTKPWDGLPEWLAQRSAWLRDVMGVPTRRQIHVSNKSLVGGLLVDDDPRNLEGRDFHDAFLISRPWNVGAPFLHGTLREFVETYPDPEDFTR